MHTVGRFLRPMLLQNIKLKRFIILFRLVRYHCTSLFLQPKENRYAV